MDDDVLVTRVIEVLAARCGWLWDPDGTRYAGTYPPGSTALFYGAVGTAPDQAVGVGFYNAADDYAGHAERWVQLHFRGARGDAAGADRLASAGFKALNKLSRVAGLNHAERTLVALLGADGNARQQRADSYLVIPDTEA